MRLQKDHTATKVRVICANCKKWFVLATGYTDLDGEAFVAYHCTPCVQKWNIAKFIVEPRKVK